MKNNLENNLFFKFFKPVFKKNWYIFSLLIILIFTPFLEGFFYRQIVDSISTDHQSISQIFLPVIYWGIVLIITFIALAVYRIQASGLAIDIEKEYVKRTYQRYWSLPVHQLISNSSGEFFAKLQSGQQAIWNIYSTIFLHLLPSWLGLLIMFILSAFINVQLTLLLFLLVPIQYFILNKGLQKNKNELKEMHQEQNKFFKLAQDSSSNVMMVKSFFSDQQIFQLIWRNFLNYSELNKKVSFRWGKINTISQIISVCSRLIVFVFGAYLVIDSQITLGTFIMFFAFSGLIFQPIQQLGEQIHRLQHNFVNVNLLEELFSSHTTEVEDLHPIESTNHDLSFQNVHFAYKEGQPILNNITFTCRKNTVTAFVGHSGVGKSTIINLINKFYSPTSGQIFIGNQNIKNHSTESIRNKTGVVFQENMMFNDTILNNITLYSDGYSDKVLQEVIDLADLREFLEKLPEGLHTQIGEKGLKISGGEKQRIAIARALFKNPGILVLDEATSNLDTISESKIQNVIKNITQDRIIIVIAHRLSTVQNADQIIVLHDRKIECIGTHQELLLKSKTYRDLTKI